MGPQSTWVSTSQLGPSWSREQALEREMASAGHLSSAESLGALLRLPRLVGMSLKMTASLGDKRSRQLGHQGAGRGLWLATA